MMFWKLHVKVTILARGLARHVSLEGTPAAGDTTEACFGVCLMIS